MKKKRWNILFIAVITIALLVYIYCTNDIHRLKMVLIQANLFWIFIAVVCMFCYWIFESGTLYYTANSIKRKLSFHKAFKTTMVGQLFNNITPFASGGQPIQAYYLIRQEFELGEATSILLMKFIIYQSAMILYTGVLLGIKLTFFIGHISSLSYLAILGFSVNLFVVIGLLAIAYLPNISLKLATVIIKLLSKIRIIKKKEECIQKTTEQVEEFHTVFKLLMTKKTVLAKSIFFTFLQLTAQFLIPLCICLALQMKGQSILSIIAASAFVMMVSSFVPLPGASGGAEGSFYLFFGIFFVDPAIVAVALVIWRIITFYLPIFVGMFYCRVQPARLDQ
ncbi:integral membrane protein LafC [Lachnospiraceae bacterium KM106-2]|nr:integral membrane protein LafC [Lachnospiraceae bacterium KM106-2]